MDERPSVPKILAAGAAVAAILVALAFLLKLVLPILAVSLGLAVAKATTGLDTSGVVATWVVPVAAGGTAVIATMVSIKVLNVVALPAEAKPDEWTLPLPGFAAGILVNMSKDLVIQQAPMRLLFGGIAALWIVIAGTCYKRQGWYWKRTAALLYLLPPSTALAIVKRFESHLYRVGALHSRAHEHRRELWTCTEQCTGSSSQFLLGLGYLAACLLPLVSCANADYCQLS
jgi:hypothetical protein